LLRRWISNLRSSLGSSSEPEQASQPDIEAAIDAARLRDQELRNEAAEVIAEKIVLKSRIEELAVAVGESRALARESIGRSDEARSAGDEGGSARWADVARSYAGSFRASKNDLGSLRSRYREAWQRAEEAKGAIQDNASRLEELVGGQSVEPDVVDRVAGALSTSIEDETPTPEALESLVDRLEGEGAVRADLQSPGRGRHESADAVNMAGADTGLDALRAELDR